jgi:Family of unknown function (DUF5320)
MPGFDKTGPMGQGPNTGGGFGLCTKAETEETLAAQSPDSLRGVGRGGQPRGGGRGRCFGGGWGRRGNRGFSNQATQLIKDNEELRLRLAKLESEKKE